MSMSYKEKLEIQKLILCYIKDHIKDFGSYIFEDYNDLNPIENIHTIKYNNQKYRLSIRDIIYKGKLQRLVITLSMNGLFYFEITYCGDDLYINDDNNFKLSLYLNSNNIIIDLNKQSTESINYYIVDGNSKETFNYPLSEEEQFQLSTLYNMPSLEDHNTFNDILTYINKESIKANRISLIYSYTFVEDIEVLDHIDIRNCFINYFNREDRFV